MWRKIIKSKKFNFIMSIVFLIVGLINLIMNNKACRFFQPTNIFIGFTPFLLATILLIIFYKKETKVKWIRIINVIFIVLSIILLIIKFGKLIISETFNKNTNVNNYERTLRVYKNNEGMEYFPVRISKDAENIKFEELPGFMQGGTFVHLAYDINKENQEKIDDELRGKSKYIIESLEDIKKLGDNIDFLSVISESIGYEGYPEKSDEFIIYIMGARKSSGEGYWNHGIEYGVIINEDKNRIIYFNECW